MLVDVGIRYLCFKRAAENGRKFFATGLHLFLNKSSMAKHI